MSSKETQSFQTGYDVKAFNDFLSKGSSLESLLDPNISAPTQTTRQSGATKTGSFRGNNFNVPDQTAAQVGLIEADKGGRLLDLLVPLYEQRVSDFRFRKGQPGVIEQTRSTDILGG